MDSATGAAGIDHERILNQRLVLVVAASAARCAGARVACDITARELAHNWRRVTALGAARNNVVEDQKDEGDNAGGLQVPRALTLIHPGVLDFLAHGFVVDALVLERGVARVGGLTLGQNSRAAPAAGR